MREQRARRTVASIALGIGVVLLGIGAAPGVASAHTPTVTARCDGLSVALTSYEGDSTNNQIVVTIDGAPTTINFGGSYSNSWSWSSALNHVWSVTIDANRTNGGKATQYDKSFSGTQVACTPNTTPTTAATTTTTTTTTTQPEVTTTTAAGETTTTAASTTTVADTTPTSLVAQEGPTTTVGQSSGAATTTVPVGRTLPATGNGSTSLIVIALTMIGIGAVMLRFASKPSR